jgi:hypothetical protein
MITQEQYFQAKPHTDANAAAAADLLARANALCQEAVDAKAFGWPSCPNTGTQVSGSKGGQGDGGFRLPTATTGRDHSSHKEAKGVDVYDPQDHLDAWLTDALLAKHGLYREHPDSTPGWCHLTTRAPGSNKRTFIP